MCDCHCHIWCFMSANETVDCDHHCDEWRAIVCSMDWLVDWNIYCQLLSVRLSAVDCIILKNQSLDHDHHCYEFGIHWSIVDALISVAFLAWREAPGYSHTCDRADLRDQERTMVHWLTARPQDGNDLIGNWFLWSMRSRVLKSPGQGQG